MDPKMVATCFPGIHKFQMEKSLLYLTSPQSLSLLIGRIIMIGKL